MTWFTHLRHQIRSKLPGRKKIKKFDAKTRRELIDICDRLSEIAKVTDKSNALSTLEVALVRLLEGFDDVTRDAVSITADNIITSKQEGKERALTTEEAIQEYLDHIDIIGTGIIARTFTDEFMKLLDENDLDPITKSHIYKQIILRLVCELEADEITQLFQYDLPRVEKEKIYSRDGAMYG